MEDMGVDELVGSDCVTHSRWHQSNDDETGITLTPSGLDVMANQNY